MKITKKHLEKIITEEIEKVLQENPVGGIMRRLGQGVGNYRNVMDDENMADMSPEEIEQLRDVSIYDALRDPTGRGALSKLIGKEVSRFMDTPLKQIKRYQKIAADNKAMRDPIMRRISNLEKRIAELALELQQLR